MTSLAEIEVLQINQEVSWNFAGERLLRDQRRAIPFPILIRE